MPVNYTALSAILKELKPTQAKLVAVSKTKPLEDILAMHEVGQKAFGENYVQELVQKYEALPKDIEWHFVGHLQTNKVKYIVPFVHLIHGVDSIKLLREINKQARKNNRIVNCLLQIHIAKEETKYGMDERELIQLLEDVIVHADSYHHVHIVGLMGMATNTAEESLIRQEFRYLRQLFDRVRKEYFSFHPYFKEISMGMSADYKIALEEGSTMVRIGSLLFGTRN